MRQRKGAWPHRLIETEGSSGLRGPMAWPYWTRTFTWVLTLLLLRKTLWFEERALHWSMILLWGRRILGMSYGRICLKWLGIQEAKLWLAKWKERPALHSEFWCFLQLTGVSTTFTYICTALSIWRIHRGKLVSSTQLLTLNTQCSSCSTGISGRWLLSQSLFSISTSWLAGTNSTFAENGATSGENKRCGSSCAFP